MPVTRRPSTPASHCPGKQSLSCLPCYLLSFTLCCVTACALLPRCAAVLLHEAVCGAVGGAVGARQQRQQQRGGGASSAQRDSARANCTALGGASQGGGPLHLQDFFIPGVSPDLHRACMVASGCGVWLATLPVNFKGR